MAKPTTMALRWSKSMPRSLLSQLRISPLKNHSSIGWLKLNDNHPSTTTSGTKTTTCQPSGIRSRMRSGNCAQAKAKVTIPSGIISSTANTPGRWVSIKGARNKPAKKPKITVGSASISSITGLIFRRTAGAIKYAVYIAPHTASGTDSNIA